MDNKLVEKVKWCKRELAGLKQAHESGVGLINFYSYYTSFSYIPSWENEFQFKITVQFDTSIEYSPMCQCYLTIPQFFMPVSVVFDEANSQVVMVYTAYINNVTLTVGVKTIAAAPITSVTLEEVRP